MPLRHRPALFDERMQLNAAGQVELKLKTRCRDSTTHLMPSPMELIQQLAALVPCRPVAVIEREVANVRFGGIRTPSVDGYGR
ncbi:hypothetical protein FQZ97_398850 [compost metagenome]